MDEFATVDRDKAGIAWASDVVGGALIDAQRQARWRSQWILTFDTVAGDRLRVLLRGYRNPGYTDDDTGTRVRLEQEADLLAALNDKPIETPRLYGFNKELGWALMEFIDGCESELTAEPDSSRRFKIYSGYVEALATLHAYPLEELDLPASMNKPMSCADHRLHMIETHIPIYRSLKLKRPEPTMEMGIQWTMANTLQDERPVCLGFGDVGPNQFLYKGDAFRAFIDVEYALIGDPLQEVGQMRSRDVTYHSGRMTEHIRHYGSCYEALTGIPLSLPDLQYWTVAGPTIGNGYTVFGAQCADPMMIDLPFALSYEVQQKLCILEGIAEIYGLQLAYPELPSERETILAPYHRAMIGQLERYYPERLTDPGERTAMQFSAAMAKTLSRGDSCYCEIERAIFDELRELLSYRPTDMWTGLAALQENIAVDHMRDLERRLNFLYRMEARRDFLFQPMQAATGVSLTRPMSRFDVVDPLNET